MFKAVLFGNVVKYASLLASILIFSTSFAYALSDGANDKASLIDVAEQQTWQHLIFLHRDRPEITTEGFYLSNQKQATPYSELLATLTLFEQDPEAKCKFPARYYWLSTQLSYDFLQQDLNSCKKIPEKIQNFSLLLVSGYLKNPVSTFGHLLLATQPLDKLDKGRLLADSYNFGAQVPPNEPGGIYAFKGITGLYSGTFAKLDYFRHNSHYSSIENRDIWEYQLDLTDIEKNILTYHLYELTIFKFDYYFFKQNCAYRTGEVLEFIDGLRMTHRKTPWYAPDYIATQLVEFDLKGHRKVIKEEIFRPSD